MTKKLFKNGRPPDRQPSGMVSEIHTIEHPHMVYDSAKHKDSTDFCILVPL